MTDLFNHDNNFFNQKFKKINLENNILKTGGKNLKNLQFIKYKQIQALETILNNLSETDLSHFNSSELNDIYQDQQEILNEIQSLKNFIQ